MSHTGPDGQFEYTPAQQLLQGRVILITGASGGLGTALSCACAKLGATVVLVGRSVKKLEAVYDQIEVDGGPQAAILPMNLMTATWGEYEALAQTLDQNFGKLDGIVHAATHFKGFARLEDIEPREWLDGLQVNLTAAYTLTRQCLPLLRRSSDASVVQICDGAPDQVKPFRGIYGLTQQAGAHLARAFAEELRAEAQLRFNSFDPGPMRTEHRTRGYAGQQATDVPSPDSRLARLLWLLGPDATGTSGAHFSD